jgi:hypothetical protein
MGAVLVLTLNRPDARKALRKDREAADLLTATNSDVSPKMGTVQNLSGRRPGTEIHFNGW